jgi:ankyrin repeat protein
MSLLSGTSATRYPKGDLGIVRLLLAQGKRLDINKQHSEGLTALSLAVRKRSLPIIDLILHDSRVNPNIIDNQGRTALWWAKLEGYRGILKRLLADNRIKVDSKDIELVA